MSVTRSRLRVPTILAGLGMLALFAAPRNRQHSSQLGAWQPATPHRSLSRHHTGASDYAWHLSGVERWRSFPIRVVFVHDSQYSAERERAILGGFNEWTRSTAGRVRFRPSSLRDADVVVRCDRRLSRSVTETRFDPDTRLLAHADVTIGLQDPDDPAALIDLDVVRSLAAHEFGHALGIDGHSNDPRDLMYPTLADNCRITWRDLNTLRVAYPQMTGETQAAVLPRSYQSRS